MTHSNKTINIVYDVVDPNTIFGMVGRCGGGYNTVWSDWSDRGRLARKKITHEFEQNMNKICGHYEKLEKNILKNGMLDPLIVTCGWPVKKQLYNIPPEILKIPPSKRLLLEGTTGGSRLWVAQKHNIPTPCIINDYTNGYKGGTKLHTVNDVKQYFNSEQEGITLSNNTGVNVPFNPTKKGTHLEDKWRENTIVKHRAPMWVRLMNEYGYYVAGLNPQINKILKDAGVVQPSHLREKWKTANPGKKI